MFVPYHGFMRFGAAAAGLVSTPASSIALGSDMCYKLWIAHYSIIINDIHDLLTPQCCYSEVTLSSAKPTWQYKCFYLSISLCLSILIFLSLYITLTLVRRTYASPTSTAFWNTALLSSTSRAYITWNIKTYINT